MAQSYRAQEQTEVVFNDFSIITILWQILCVALLIILIYFMIQLYRKVTKYLDSKNHNYTKK